MYTIPIIFEPCFIIIAEYIAPFYEEPRPAKGCVSLERHKENGFQVVVVRSNATSDNVLLILNGKYLEYTILLYSEIVR